MSFEVVLTGDAERDLETLFDHIAAHDSPGSAERVLNQILKVAESLRENPHRGARPAELRELGEQGYRQVLFKPYRVIYQVMGKQVFIYLIADGRRDMQSLLMDRMLGGR